VCEGKSNVNLVILSPTMATTKRRGSTVSATEATNGRVRIGRGAKHHRASVAQRYSAVHLAWYAGLTLMVLFEVIEWPVALVIAVGHDIAHRARNKALRALAEGIEAAG
jgi:hypothetical protein